MDTGSRFSVRIDYKWWVTIAVTLGMFMSLMDSTIVNVAIPQMQGAFRANLQAVQWVVTIYMLTQAAVIPVAPYLALTFGSKRAYVWTLSAFLLGSLLCGLAWNLPSLIFFRFIQGIGGGILLPMVMTLQYQAFPPEERGTAASVAGLALMVAPAFGPVLGGYLVSSFGWQWAFFINVPLGIIAVIMAQKLLRETPTQPGTHFDILGFLTVASGSAILLYAISAVSSGGNLFWNIGCFIVGIILLITFALIELSKARRGPQPLLDLRRFRDRAFGFSVLALVFVAFIRFGILFLVPIYLQNLHQQSAFQAGIIQAAQALSTLAILPIGGRLADKLGPRPVVLAGLILLTVSASLMVTLALDTAIWMIIGILLLLGAANALVQQIPVAAMSRIKHEEHKEIANGSTLVTVLHATAAPMGVAILASIVQVRSQHYLTSPGLQGLTGKLLQHQSTLLGMHESFLIAAGLAIIAFIVMCFVPGNKKSSQQFEQPEQTVLAEELAI